MLTFNSNPINSTNELIYTYNYLVSRVNAIVLDMEKAATEIANIVADIPPTRKA